MCRCVRHLWLARTDVRLVGDLSLPTAEQVSPCMAAVVMAITICSMWQHMLQVQPNACNMMLMGAAASDGMGMSMVVASPRVVGGR